MQVGLATEALEHGISLTSMALLFVVDIIRLVDITAGSPIRWLGNTAFSSLHVTTRRLQQSALTDAELCGLDFFILTMTAISIVNAARLTIAIRAFLDSVRATSMRCVRTHLESSSMCADREETC